MGLFEKISVVVALLLLITSINIFAYITYNKYIIPSESKVKTVNINAWWHENMTKPITFIDWGMNEPGDNVSRLVYISSQSNIPINLTMYTDSWSPINTTNFITLSWNYTGEILAPDDIIPIEFTLHISPDIVGIEHFSFNIIIIGSEIGEE